MQEHFPLQLLCRIAVGSFSPTVGSSSLHLLCRNTVGSFSPIFLDRVYEEHVTSHKSHRGRGYPNQMDFGAFLDFMLAWDNRSSWVGICYFFPVLDLKGRGYLTQVLMPM